MQTKVIAVANSKGGIGKTTTATNLASILHSSGKYKSLLIDLDAQCDASFVYNLDTSKPSILDVMLEESNIRDTIQLTESGYGIPGSKELAGIDVAFANEIARESVFKSAIEPIVSSGEFSHIIVDCPPNYGLTSVMALTAANEIIIPIGADILSLNGLGRFYNEVIKKVKKLCNSDLTIAGLLITRYDGRSSLSKEFKEALKETSELLDTKLFDSVIREGVAIKDSQFRQASIITNPKSKQSNDYLHFVQEYLGVNSIG